MGVQCLLAHLYFHAAHSAWSHNSNEQNEKPEVVQLVTKFSLSYGSWRVITVYKRINRRSIFWATMEAILTLPPFCPIYFRPSLYAILVADIPLCVNCKRQTERYIRLCNSLHWMIWLNVLAYLQDTIGPPIFLKALNYAGNTLMTYQ